MFLSMQIEWKHYLKFRPNICDLTLIRRYCIDLPCSHIIGDKHIDLDVDNHSNG